MRIKPILILSAVTFIAIIITSIVFFILYPQVTELYSSMGAEVKFIISPVLLFFVSITLEVLVLAVSLVIGLTNIIPDTQYNAKLFSIIAMIIIGMALAAGIIDIYIPIYNISNYIK